MGGAEPPDAGSRPPTAESDWLRTAQASELLGVARATLLALTDEGRITAFYTEGEHRRYRRRDLVRLKAELDGEGGGSVPAA
jgi:excisionase family DNA binding protein